MCFMVGVIARLDFLYLGITAKGLQYGLFNFPKGARDRLCIYVHFVADSIIFDKLFTS